MAPTKSTRVVSKQTVGIAAALIPLGRKGLTRRTASNVQDQNCDLLPTRGKRKAEHSPQKNQKIKRSALGNLTNNVNNNNQQMTFAPHEDDANQDLAKKKVAKSVFSSAVDKQESCSGTLQVFKDTPDLIQPTQPTVPKPQTSKVLTRASSKATIPHKEKQSAINLTSKTFDDSDTKLSTCQPPPNDNNKDMLPAVQQAPCLHPQVQKLGTKRRISNEFNKTEESLYMSALEDMSSSDSLRLSENFEAVKRRSLMLKQQLLDEVDVQKDSAVETNKVPEGVEDFDLFNWNDPFQVSHYANDIFRYLKEREVEFPIDNYMERQVHLSKWMRTLLVDWMVEVQETFELNHETLYLAVKIVDKFLCKEVIVKDKLQLLGAAALFIACKFDERTPPLIEDFLYICDGAYKHDELIHMEMATLKTINFDLGIPLSYRFLRRYARCAKVPMPTLTLARYILELSLMDYDCISFSDSKMACAVLFMALRLHGDEKPWTPTLIYYTGYELTDFDHIVPILNAGLHRKPKGTIKTIRSKYSHKIFHEVAKVSLMTTEKFFENQLDLNFSLLCIKSEQQQKAKQSDTSNENKQ